MKKQPDRIQNLGYGMYQIDLYEQGQPNRTACYVIQGEQNVLIETGSSLAAPYIQSGLEALGIAPDSIASIIVTHIHLDHAGGAGTMAKICPRAHFYVHPRGHRHLVDPSRLVAGARSVYGDDLEKFFGDVLPVPPDRVFSKTTGDTLDLGHGRTLHFYDSPGHARHHFSIFDPASGVLFTGDTAGIRYIRAYTGLPFDYLLPSTTPSEFDPEAALQSLERLAQLRPSRICHGHFGMSDDPETVFQETRRGIIAFTELARSAYNETAGPSAIEEAMRAYIRRDLSEKGVSLESTAPFELDIVLNSLGLHGYMKQHTQAPGS